MFLILLLLAFPQEAPAQRIYDNSGRQIGRVDSNRYYDGSGRLIGRADGLTNREIVLFFFFFR